MANGWPSYLPTTGEFRLRLDAVSRELELAFEKIDGGQRRLTEIDETSLFTASEGLEALERAAIHLHDPFEALLLEHPELRELSDG